MSAAHAARRHSTLTAAQGHETRIESFSSTVPADRVPADRQYHEEVRVYEQDRVRRPQHKEEVHVYEQERRFPKERTDVEFSRERTHEQ